MVRPVACRFCGRPIVVGRCTRCEAGLCSEEHFRRSCQVLHPGAELEPLPGTPVGGAAAEPDAGETGPPPAS